MNEELLHMKKATMRLLNCFNSFGNDEKFINDMINVEKMSLERYEEYIKEALSRVEKS